MSDADITVAYLGTYYLDFYNEHYATYGGDQPVGSLEDTTMAYMVNLFSCKNPGRGGQHNAMGPETNPLVAALGYYYFYHHLLNRQRLSPCRVYGPGYRGLENTKPGAVSYLVRCQSPRRPGIRSNERRVKRPGYMQLTIKVLRLNTTAPSPSRIPAPKPATRPGEEDSVRRGAGGCRHRSCR